MPAGNQRVYRRFPSVSALRTGGLVVALTLAACSSGGSTPSTRTTSTSTTVRPSSSTTAPVTGTPVGSVDPVLEQTSPPGPEVDAPSCRALLPAGLPGDCGDLTHLTWLVGNGTGEGRFVRIFSRDGAVHHQVQLAEDPDGTGWSVVTIRPVGDALAVGFRDPGSGQFLSIDVVDPDGTVGASVRLDHGRAAISGDRLETWSARFGPDDPNCCPGAWVHQVLAHGKEGWVVASEDEAADSPQGDFP